MFQEIRYKLISTRNLQNNVLAFKGKENSSLESKPNPRNYQCFSLKHPTWYKIFQDWGILFLANKNTDTTSEVQQTAVSIAPYLAF